MDPFGISPKFCHLVLLTGPKDAVANYQKTAKERFESPDPAIVEHLGQSVSVSVPWVQDSTTGFGGGPCLTHVPQRLVFVAKGGDEPTLVVPLKVDDHEAKNRQGAVWTVHDGSAELALADLEKLRGKELELHVIFAERVQKESWKKDYVDKVLK